ncbi:MAG: nitroreductase family protein [Acidimicrobiaceae bacterium]|nr:nitroreductase family protein [Acidimicrobiaceae bacterium]
MDLRTAMRTTPATRVFTSDPVPDNVVYEILDDARFAPNGGNRQAWHVIVVRDAATKRRIAELYELGTREYAAHAEAGLVPFVASEALERQRFGEPYHAAVDLDAARQVPSANGVPEYMANAPVLLVLTIDLSAIPAVDTGLERLSIAGGASIYPFAHNILLAARARGYGGHITTLLARQEPELRSLLHIPPEQALATMLPIGRPEKEITRLRRLPVEAFVTKERADGPALEAPKP